MRLTRWSIGALLFVGACGGDSGTGTTATPQTGTARFTRDANTCNGAPLSFDFFMDGAALGSSTLAAGASAAYTVAAGSHTFGAKVTNTALLFATINGAVSAGSTFTYTIVCQ